MHTAVSPFTVFLAVRELQDPDERYAELKAIVTQVGRRRAKLRLLDAFWALTSDEKERLARLAEDPESAPILLDALEDINSLDGQEEAQILEYVDEASVAGVVVRTDFSDDAAWERFVGMLLQAERDIAIPVEGEENSEQYPDSSSSDSEDEDSALPDQDVAHSALPASLFALLSPPASSPLRERLTGVSNLTALRLVNEVDVVRAPVPVVGSENTASVSPSHRLTNLHGFVEAYTGPLVWIYDSRSNTDQAVRVVSQHAEGISAATADSWRARVSFLPELQLHLAGGTMKIDFGGLDRWDHVERHRNLAESDSSSS